MNHGLFFFQRLLGLELFFTDRRRLPVNLDLAVQQMLHDDDVCQRLNKVQQVVEFAFIRAGRCNGFVICRNHLLMVQIRVRLYAKHFLEVQVQPITDAVVEFAQLFNLLLDFCLRLLYFLICQLFEVLHTNILILLLVFQFIRGPIDQLLGLLHVLRCGPLYQLPVLRYLLLVETHDPFFLELATHI